MLLYVQYQLQYTAKYRNPFLQTARPGAHGKYADWKKFTFRTSDPDTVEARIPTAIVPT